MNVKRSGNPIVGGKLQLWWLLTLATIILVFWQLPVLSVVHRQVGMKTFLQLTTPGDPLPAGRPWPVSDPVEVGTLEATEGYLVRANRQADTTRLLGVIALARNDLPGARHWLQRRLETAPDDPLAHFFLGETYLRAGEPARTISEWETVGAKAHLTALAKDLIEKAAPQEALSALEAVMRLDPTDIESRKLAADILIQQGQIEPALTLYLELIALEPDKAVAYDRSGRALFDAGQYAQAIGFFKEALQRNPANPPLVLERLGQSYGALGQWQEAAQAFQQAIDQDPTSSRAYVRMAEAQCKLGQPANARDFFEQAVASGDYSGEVRKAAEYIARTGSCP
jgi:tetratricopeptide (TPR) repeat protein